MDDIEFLLNHAKEESYLFVVDSRQRDTAVYPSPSQYEVAFSSPFRYVFGMDLLDATVARTEYIVDTTTNSLEFVMAQPASLAEFEAWAPAKRRVELDPGDYNLPQLVDHLNAKLAASATLHGEPPIKCAAVSNPAEVSNRVVFTCSQAFTLLMGTSSLRHTLGFGDPVTTTASPDYAAVPGWSVNRTGGASDTFLSLPAAVLDGDPGTAALGPVPAGQGMQFEKVFAGRAVRQFFTSQTTGPVSTVQAYVFGGAGCPGITIAVRRAADDALVATGTLAGPEVAGNADSAYEPLVAAMTGTGLLVAGTAYYAELACGGNEGTTFAAVYYNEDNVPVAGDRYIQVGGATVHLGSNLCLDVATASWGHTVRCPGIVNLTGPRFVGIRCPEIESHLFRDRVNERVHAGLGMVQLRGYGFRDQRFDFVSFPSRKFHPIGKLSKLTFRLERPDGTLYDSHGVDHTLLLVLKYYALPARVAALTAEDAHSSLNPNYTPDYQRYMITQKWASEAAATDRTRKRY